MNLIDVDPLPAAVLAAEQHARDDPSQPPPRLFALVPAQAAPGQFDVIPQPALPDEPFEDLLDELSWPPAVVGCVSVTDLVLQDPDSPLRVTARLAVGATRDGAYAACLRYDGAEDVLVGAEVNELAQDLVGALVGTLEPQDPR